MHIQTRHSLWSNLTFPPGWLYKIKSYLHFFFTIFYIILEKRNNKKHIFLSFFLRLFCRISELFYLELLLLYQQGLQRFCYALEYTSVCCEMLKENVCIQMLTFRVFCLPLFVFCVLEQYYFTAFVKSNKMVTHTLTVFVNTSRNDFVSRFNLNYINC